MAVLDKQTLGIAYNAMMEIGGHSMEEANAWYDAEMRKTNERDYAYPQLVVDLQQHVKGLRIEKRSGRTFKSGLTTATVAGIKAHPYKAGSYAYTMLEDESAVEIFMCKIID